MIGAIVMPCSPSAPPVSQFMRFAISCTTSTVTRLSMISVRRRPRSSTLPDTTPSSAAAAPPAARPTSGSAEARSARMPAV
jgi:hypothetical protein